MTIVRTSASARQESPRRGDASSFFDIIGEKFEQRGLLFGLLDTLSIGQQAATGITKEVIRREKGQPALPIWQQVKRSIRHSDTFTSVTGEPWSGFILDVIVDPINVVAFGPKSLGQVAAKGLIKVPGVTKGVAGVTRGARAVHEFTEAQVAIRKTKEAFGKAFKRKFLLKKHNPQKILDAQNELLGQLLENSVLAGKHTGQMLERLVPSLDERKKILDLLEREPVNIKGAIDPSDPRFIEWRKEFGTLSDDARFGYRLARRTLDDLEAMKIEAGLLTQARAAGLIAKLGGGRYVPHRLATKQNFLDEARRLEASLEAGESGGAATVKLDDLREWIATVEKMPEALNTSMVEEIRKFYKVQKLSDSELRRTLDGTATEQVKAGVAQLELDIAKVLQIESRQVANAVATQHYMKTLAKYADESGLAISREIANNPRLLGTHLKQFMSTDEAVKRIREGFREVKGLDVMRNKFLPNSLADEVELTFGAYSDSVRGKGFIEDTVATWRNVTNFWKAWTLAPFISYHSRNILSNFWNNGLAGMKASDPLTTQSYILGTTLRTQWGKGIFAEGDIFKRFVKGKEFESFTSRQLYRVALKNRWIRGGQFHETGLDIIGDATKPRNWIIRQMDPRTSKIVEKGFAFGGWAEDSMRVAHGLFKMSKGSGIKESSRSIQKFLFDYQHGLTPFEAKFFRDGLIPFYTWTRFNIPLQLEMLVHQPKKFTTIFKAKRSIEERWGGPEPNEVFLAEWLKRTAKVRVRYNERTKTYEYFSLNSWLPAADIGKLGTIEGIGQEILNLLHPAKVVFELLFNYSFFTRRDIRVPGKKTDFFGVELPGAFEPYVAKAEHLVKTVRLVGDFERAMKFATADETAGPFSQTLRFLQRTTVGKAYPVKIEDQKKWWTRNLGVDLGRARRELKKAKTEGNTNKVRIIEKAIKELEDLKSKHLRVR